MEQAILIEPGIFEVKEAASLEPNDEEVVVSISYCGVCGSDVHAYLGKHPRAQYPYVFGHEASGIIKSVGSSVENIKPGDPVAVIPLIACGTCEFCKQGRPNLCRNRNVLGYQRPGCFSEELVIPKENVIPLENRKALLSAALLEPLAVSVRSASFLNRLQSPAEEILITGGGAIGTTLAMTFCATTNKNITVLERNPQRLDTLTSLNIKTVTDLTEYKPLGPRIICCECSGSENVFNSLMESAHMLDAIIITSVFDREFSIPLLELTKSEVIFVGSQMYTIEDYHKASGLLSDKFSQDILKLLDDTIYPLEEIGKAFEASLRPETKNKVMVRVQEN